MKRAIEGRLSEIPELAPLIGRARKTPRLAATFAAGIARIEILTDSPKRDEARRLIHMARRALHGRALVLDGRAARARHIATDYVRDGRDVRAIAHFRMGIDDEGRKAAETAAEEEAQGQGEGETPAEEGEGLHDA